MRKSEEFMIENGFLIACNGPGGDVVIPDHVVYIDRSVFTYCDNLISVTLPKGLRSIEQEAFRGCINLKEVKASKNETQIAQSAPDSSDEAWFVDAAFMGCENLTTVEIPDGITGIDTAVFMNCPNLSSLTIPKTVTYIDRMAFDNIAPLSLKKSDAPDTEQKEEEGFSVSLMIGIVKEPTKPLIHGFSGSYAEQFAKENGFPFCKIS